ncbi:MAG: response regulator [Desulfomonile tiedjei]|nr:response regulator [Desulfomonile tiedjei]
MPNQRKIKAGELVRDIRSGATDSALMEKHGLSVGGLQKLFKQMLATGIVQPDELCARNSGQESSVVLEEPRAVPRVPLHFSLPVQMTDRPEVAGVVEEISGKGLRTTNIETKVGEVMKLAIPADRLFAIEPLAFEARCRWMIRDGAGSRCTAGFEIIRELSGSMDALIAAIQSIPLEGRSISDLDPFEDEDEEITETVDLATLFTHDVTSSGSFNFRGINQTWFGRLLQALPIPALLVDPTFHVTFLNSACGNVGEGYKRIRGRAFSSLFPDASEVEKANRLVQTVFSTRKPESSQAEIEIGTGKVWGRIHLRPVRMGLSRSVLVLVEDLTHEKEQLALEQRHKERLLAEIAERRKAEVALLQAERLKAVGELASGVSHNFNNLLQIVIGNAQLALANLEEGDAAGVRSNIERIVRSSTVGSGTIKRLQNFARKRVDQSRSEWKVFDLSEVVRQAVEMTTIWWKTVPEKSGLSISLVPRLTDHCKVRGRAEELFEVAMNLIKNAAEALPQGGEIRVETLCDRDQAVLRVTDTGVGISPEHMGRLFEPFFTTKQSHSAGMGLASSFGIAKSHGGAIRAEGRPGGGTVFTVSLPFVREDYDLEGSSAAPDLPSSLSILVIDDLEPIVSFLKEGLEHHRHTVLTALSGEDGLQLFRETPVHVVICDLGMPGMSGWEVGKRIATLCEEQGRPKPAFILLTGWGDQSEETGLVAESCVDLVLEKPVPVSGLLKAIRGLLRSQ